MLAHLLEQGGWDIVAVSRRKPRIPGNYSHIALDLLNPADCRAKLGPLADISHLFYLAITERSDPGATASANSTMFFNLVKTVEAASRLLEHVHLSQGTKVVRNHLVPYRLRPRRTIRGICRPNFYYDRQDFLEELQKGESAGPGFGRASARGLRSSRREGPMN